MEEEEMRRRHVRKAEEAGDLQKAAIDGFHGTDGS